MKKQTNTLLLAGLLLLLSIGCKKNCPEKDYLKNVALDFDRTPVPGDNTTQTTIKVMIPATAVTDRRKVTLSTDLGTLSGAKDGKLEVTCVADQDNSCVLTAIATFISPSKPGTAHITSLVGTSEFTDSITVVQSDAIDIKLSTNTFAVKVDFGSEAIITGKIVNNKNKPASEGYKVQFSDIQQNGYPAGGHMRDAKTTSDASGAVSVVYSPGFSVAIGDSVDIKADVLDKDGNTLNPPISKNIKLYLIKNE